MTHKAIKNNIRTYGITAGTVVTACGALSYDVDARWLGVTCLKCRAKCTNREVHAYWEEQGAISARRNAAQALRAIPSEKRSETSRENGKKGGRPKKNASNIG